MMYLVVNMINRCKKWNNNLMSTGLFLSGLSHRSVDRHQSAACSSITEFFRGSLVFLVIGQRTEVEY